MAKKGKLKYSKPINLKGELNTLISTDFLYKMVNIMFHLY